jgi:hypothetical protein
MNIDDYFSKLALGTRSQALKLVSQANGWGKDLFGILKESADA